ERIAQSARDETAALRDFEPAYVGSGSNPAFEVMSAARPLFHQEQTFVGTHRTSVSCQRPTFPLSALRRALGDDVDDLKRHHYFAGLIDYLDERGDRAPIGL